MTTFDDLYADVPADQRERLRAFRAAHPARAISDGSVTWEYLAAGSPDAPAVLLLVGGLRTADAGFRAIEELKNDFYVLTPTYPALHSAGALCDGLAAVLSAEQIARAHVMGGSFGGMMAQCFIRQYPARVGRVVLSNTIAPSAETAQHYQHELDMLANVDPLLLMEGAKHRFLYTIDPPQDEEAFWKAYLAELFDHRLTKDDLISSYHCLVDFAQRTFAPGEVDAPLLLIESADDHTFDSAQRAAVRALYTAAQVYTFTEGGHSPGTTRRAEYFDLVRRFLRGG